MVHDVFNIRCMPLLSGLHFKGRHQGRTIDPEVCRLSCRCAKGAPVGLM